MIPRPGGPVRRCQLVPADRWYRPGMIKLALVALIALVGVTAAPGVASAKIPVIYQSGEDAFACGPLPAPYDQEPELAGYQAGYVCGITGVFWSYFSVKNCRAAAFKGDTYIDNAELSAAIKAKYPESSMKRGLWNRFGWVLLALAVVVGLGLWLKDKITGKDDDDE